MLIRLKLLALFAFWMGIVWVGVQVFGPHYHASPEPPCVGSVYHNGIGFDERVCADGASSDDYFAH